MSVSVRLSTPFLALAASTPLAALQLPESRGIAGPPVGHPQHHELFDVGDFDGDGDLDLLRDHDMREVIWTETRPGTAPLTHVVSTFTNDLYVGRAGDLDGDGDPDASAGTATSFRWYANVDGQGKFGGSQLVTNTVSELRSAALADLDLDGDLDVVLGLGTGTSWWRNTDGVGNFLGPFTVGLSDDATQVVTGDADFDGDTDVLVGSGPAGEIRYYENLLGTGLSWSLAQLDTGGLDPSFLDWGDLDGDDDLDVVAATYGASASRLAWLENDGGFGAPLLLEEREGPVVCALADFDGDGHLDIASSWSEGELMQWSRNADGAGSFAPPQPIDAPFYGYVLLPADLAGNGSVDLVSKSRGMRGVWLHENTGGGTFAPVQGLAADTYTDTVWTADVDGDGDLDFVGSSRGLASANSSVWHENVDGKGTFLLGGIVATGAADEFPADLDGDGDVDVLIGHSPEAGASGQTTAWVENLGAGHFGGERIIAQVDATRVRAGDLDGDGELDVVAGSRAAGTQAFDDAVFWYRNLGGAQTFSPALALAPGMSGIGPLVPADLDADGDLDVLTAGLFGDPALFVENLDGLGQFAAAEVIVSDDVYSLAASDLDTDGDLDVLAAAEGRVLWLRNTDGAGALSAPIDLLTWEFNPFVLTRALAEPADLDGDGDVDLFAIYPDGDGGDRVEWFENVDGAMTLGPGELLHTDDFLIGVGSGDLDGDGVADPIASTGTSGGIYFSISAVRWWPSATGCEGQLEGQEVVRLGSPANPEALLPGLGGAPVIGGTWDPVVDHTSFLPGAIADFLLVSPAAANLPSSVGTILCAYGPGSVIQLANPGEPFQVALPHDCDLVGLTICAQGGTFLPSLLFFVTNALDATVGSP